MQNQKMPNNTHETILITIDVEDWFQVENFKPCIPFSTWDTLDIRVEKNTHSLLDLFESIELNNNTKTKKLKATFFILGWIAKRLPGLVKEIKSRGHEIASHGFYHNLCTHGTSEELKHDLTKSKELLEDITGSRISGYRAPNFSVDNEALKIIQECGYLYDSSYNSFSLNPRYGRVIFNGEKKSGIAINISDDFYELPLSNLKIGSAILPLSGGGYFRLFPSFLFNRGVRSILNKEGVYLFYLHPWELDPDQPRVRAAPILFKLRHYINLKKTGVKLDKFLKRFNKCDFITCSQYIENIHQTNVY